MPQPSPLAPRRSLRSSTASRRSAAGLISDCGHSAVHFDPNSDRDIKCNECWKNREILIQRLIAPFEQVITLEREEEQQQRRASTTETSEVSSERIGSNGTDGERTAAGGAGIVGEPVAAPTTTADADEDAKMVSAPLDELDLSDAPESVNEEPVAAEVDEGECIRVLDISEAKPQQQSPATNGEISSSPAPEKLRRGSAPSIAKTAPGKGEQLPAQPIDVINNIPSRSKSVDKVPKTQRTLFSFFGPSSSSEKDADRVHATSMQRKRTGSTSSAAHPRASREAKTRALEKTHAQVHTPFPDLRKKERPAVEKARRSSSSSATAKAASPPVASRRSTRGRAGKVTYYENTDSEDGEIEMN